MLGILGKKIGMTNTYVNGKYIPVTVITSGPCSVIYTKNEEKDKYTSVALGYEEQKESRLTKALNGVFKKAGVSPKKNVKEFRLTTAHEYKPGDEVTIELLKNVKYVDITARSKGKGFQGGMKRHGFSGGPASHGASLFHRATGSRGNRIGKVHKGKKSPGRMGNDQVTKQRLEIIKLDPINNMLVVRGSIPGHNNGLITIKPSIKS